MKKRFYYQPRMDVIDLLTVEMLFVSGNDGDNFVSDNTIV